VPKLTTESRIKKFRPALILSNDSQNELSNEVIVAPLSSQVEVIRSFEIYITPDQINGLKKPSKILLNSLRVISKERLQELSGPVDPLTLASAQAALHEVLNLTACSFGQLNALDLD
jgi:mRNA interferase MazF